MKKFLAILLAAVMVLSVSVTAFANEDIRDGDLLEMEAEIGVKEYLLYGPVSSLRQQGVEVTEPVSQMNKEILYSGYWYKALIGETEIALLLTEDKVADDVYVIGYRLTQEKAPGAEAGDFRLGRSTRRDVERELGASEDGRYRLVHDYASVKFGYEDNHVRSVEVINILPVSFGVCEHQDRDDDRLPDGDTLGETEFILDDCLYSGKICMADLLANGWHLSGEDAGKELEPRSSASDYSASGVWMYNGEGFIEVFPYNESTEKACSIEEAALQSIWVYAGDNTEVEVEKGLELGDTVRELKRAFGEDLKEEKRIGFTEYKTGRLTFRISDKTVDTILIWIPLH